MLSHLRDLTGGRRAWAALWLLALATRIMVPSGYMPGTGIATPIVLCTGQGPMPAMETTDEAGHSGSSKAPHGAADHTCAFAGIGGAALVAGPDRLVLLPPGLGFARQLPVRSAPAAPGRGMAAPPPPSHAPPRLHA